MAAGLHSGLRALRPTMPETWGQDMEVPDIVMYGTVLLSNGSPIGLITGEGCDYVHSRCCHVRLQRIRNL